MIDPRAILRNGAVVLAISGVWLGLAFWGALDGIEQEAMRWRYWTRGQRQSSAPIAYVNIDARATSKLGARPWDRRDFGRAALALLEAGQARALAFDIIFSKYSLSPLLDPQQLREGDKFLGQIVRQFNDRVVLAAAYTGVVHPLTDEVAKLPLIREGYDDPRVAPFPEAPTFPIVRWDSGRLGLTNVDESMNKSELPNWVVGFVELKGARFTSHLMDGLQMHWHKLAPDADIKATEDKIKLVDADGFVIAELPKQSHRRIFTLGLETYLAANDIPKDKVAIGRDAIEIPARDGEGTRRVPLAERQSIEVNWFGSWHNERLNEHYSLKDVLEKADALAEASEAGDSQKVAELEQWFASRFEDKVIMVGPVDTMLKDRAPTPYDREPVPKVGVHGNLYRTIHSGAFISRPPFWVNALLTLGLTGAVSVLALWNGRGRFATKFGSVLLIAVFAGVVWLAFDRAHWVVPFVAPAGSAVSAALFAVLVRLSREEHQRRRIKSLFGAYVSPQIVDEMVEAGRDPELGGVEAEITALFSDIQDFSAVSEQLAPNKLVGLLNDYLSEMTDAIQAEGGTLDKYIGDAIVAMFGMPLRAEDHAARACRAAARMQELHAELRERLAGWGEATAAVDQVRTRVGINTGRAVVGNMGSQVRFNYTMMGDSVNLASRCESGAKLYGVYTMVTDATRSAALEREPELAFRHLDRIVVKGRTEAADLYEMWGWESGLDDTCRTCRAAYEEALAWYFEGRWEEAIAAFERAAASEPNRGRVGRGVPATPSDVMIERCRHFLREGSPERWDGVYHMPEK